jgi:hypothetical protein
MLLVSECLSRLCVAGVNLICYAILELGKSFMNQVGWVMIEPYR